MNDASLRRTFVIFEKTIMAGINWKREEDVKEYIANIYTEYCFSCLHEKNPEGCQLLGDYLETIKKDYQGSAKIYSANCEEHSFPASCYKAGSNSLIGRGTIKDQAKALEYFKKGCAGQYKDACFMSGALMVSQELTGESKKEYAQGIENLVKGCLLSHERSCFTASQFYGKGVDGVIEKDPMKAFEFALKACELGNRYACSNVSQMYKKGQGVEKNQELYAKYKSAALEIHKQMYCRNKNIEFQQHIE